MHAGPPGDHACDSKLWHMTKHVKDSSYKSCLDCGTKFRVVTTKSRCFACQKVRSLKLAYNRCRLNRLKKRGVIGSHTDEEWFKIVASQDEKCALCSSMEKLERDHIVPTSRGGTDYIENVQGLCRPCNIKKANRIYKESQLLDPRMLSGDLKPRFHKNGIIMEPSVVLEIYNLKGKKTAKYIASEYRVSRSAVLMIWCGLNHSGITGHKKTPKKSSGFAS